MSISRKTPASQGSEDLKRSRPFRSPADVEAFFRACDELNGPAEEPEWHEHLSVIEKSRKRGKSNT